MNLIMLQCLIVQNFRKLASLESPIMAMGIRMSIYSTGENTVYNNNAVLYDNVTTFN